ncbi:predicted protein [Sclerotinia sclerotiorum 1980 UF-70]|uniref:Uncharacterized protein n=2 Tax=Sclerotinia sclerotiorum (strain ATCC 18683 / 1980 / Ss-1) TaxID=665079 RepID=A7EW84_SCLS1|nr:predicted protein [Sclerotinia sclerotiorum 1980 UF-70]APA15602.1 hypothetical protein sscle_15g103720 [Sclerotinia sclerotiorum 1980 UF-70]EDN93726.1 predicted protein [Sclerotinia sclerotiorum 1980 UF-70]
MPAIVAYAKLLLTPLRGLYALRYGQQKWPLASVLISNFPRYDIVTDRNNRKTTKLQVDVLAKQESGMGFLGRVCGFQIKGEKPNKTLFNSTL